MISSECVLVLSHIVPSLVCINTTSLLNIIVSLMNCSLTVGRATLSPIHSDPIQNTHFQRSNYSSFHDFKASGVFPSFVLTHKQMRCAVLMLCYVMLCYVMLCYVMSCYVMLCYVMLCYVMLCHVMLCLAQCGAAVRCSPLTTAT